MLNVEVEQRLVVDYHEVVCGSPRLSPEKQLSEIALGSDRGRFGDKIERLLAQPDLPHDGEIVVENARVVRRGLRSNPDSKGYRVTR